MKYLKIIFKKIPKRFKNKKTIVLIFAVLLIVYLGLRGGANQDLIQTANAQKGTVKSEVFATGKIESDSQSSLNFPVSGKVVWVNVKEGDFVKKGQAIASLDKEKFEVALRQAQQDVIAADAKLEKVYDDLPDNRIESFQDKINRTAAEAVKNQAFDAVKLAERNLKDTILTALIEGTLVELNINVGDEILPTETVARIADTNTIQFTAEIDESDIGKINLGQTAIIFLDAFEDVEILSSVTSIGLEGKITATEATVFEVVFELEKKDKYILGMNGDVQILTNEQNNVLTVPIEALFEENIVWVRENGSYSQKEVEVGIQNDIDAEIKSGLEEGEKVVISGFDEIGKESLIQKLLP
ncbi:hypothetical protein A3J17_05225 [Candidatus Curtissbacteria bacterium RIFCSPLOWO2_02_FULL_40_11]|uniref:Uncharacterized protein n=1 Tax=Candidatus Curtissbacteria bacterium RIFCSPHIGHO2_02_FULL_40_16b TaxID=1797714 RepID=A0A1F5G8S5_9BACT|nr:MAG: hypothetical protein A3D04_00620 [Candidatus Curtissbacteria bacterium RIFCSPHIGHO2_02_FULL_40_16b]OGE00058.1 MAG: hypothetical protein A3J17_05225 [Candidatus Curtissbacteria bacterium RIFCSPLOWO2_02_FULL_40_11]